MNTPTVSNNETITVMLLGLLPPPLLRPIKLLLLFPLHMTLPCNLLKLSLFERSDYADVTRQSSSFRQTYVRTTKKQHCISATGIKLWNCNENYIKNRQTEQVSKTKFKCFLISFYLDTVENANK